MKILLFAIMSFVILFFSLYLGKTTLVLKPFSIRIERKILAISYLLLSIAIVYAIKLSNLNFQNFNKSAVAIVLMTSVIGGISNKLIKNKKKKNK